MKVGTIVHKKDGDYRVVEYEELPRWDNDGKLVNPVVLETLEKIQLLESRKSKEDCSKYCKMADGSCNDCDK